MTDLTYLDHPILAIFPNVRGFGYALFLENGLLKIAGVAYIKNQKQGLYLKRISDMVDTYNPSMILLPASDGKYNRKSERVQKLLKEIRRLANRHNLIVKTYTRVEIRNTFKEFKKKSKVEIAQTIDLWFPNITKKCPEPRKTFEAEHHAQGTYDAVSLVITYYADMIEKNRMAVK